MHATQASRVLTILRRRCTPLHPATRRAGPSRYALLLGAIDARGPRQFKTVDELKGATRVSMLAAEPQNVGDLDTQLGLLRASELPPSTMRALNEADDHWPSVVDVLLKSGEYIVEYVSVHAAKVLGATVIVHRPIVLPSQLAEGTVAPPWNMPDARCIVTPPLPPPLVTASPSMPTWQVGDASATTITFGEGNTHIHLGFNGSFEGDAHYDLVLTRGAPSPEFQLAFSALWATKRAAPTDRIGYWDAMETATLVPVLAAQTTMGAGGVDDSSSDADTASDDDGNSGKNKTFVRGRAGARACVCVCVLHCYTLCTYMCSEGWRRKAAR